MPAASVADVEVREALGVVVHWQHAGLAVPSTRAAMLGGGCTWCSRAQARRSSGLMQQQLVQHSSGLAQPQRWSMQGNGTLDCGLGKPTKPSPPHTNATAMANATAACTAVRSERREK